MSACFLMLFVPYILSIIISWPLPVGVVYQSMILQMYLTLNHKSFTVKLIKKSLNFFDKCNLKVKVLLEYAFGYELYLRVACLIVTLRTETVSIPCAFFRAVQLVMLSVCSNFFMTCNIYFHKCYFKIDFFNLRCI